MSVRLQRFCTNCGGELVECKNCTAHLHCCEVYRIGADMPYCNACAHKLTAETTPETYPVRAYE